MNFSVNLGQLLETYDLISKAVGGKQVKPILQNVYVEVKKDSLTLRGFNNQVFIERSVVIKNNEKKELVFCLPTFVFSVLSFYPNKTEDVIFEKSKNNGKFITKQDTRENEFSYISAENYPDRVILEGYENSDLKELIEAMKLTKVGVDDLARNAALRCYHFFTDSIITGDGKQFAKYELDHTFEDSLLNARNVLGELNKILDDLVTSEDVEATCSENWLGFRSLSKNTEVSFLQYNTELTNFPEIFDAVYQSKNEAEKRGELTKVKIPLDKLKESLKVSVLYEAEAIATANPSYTTLDIKKDIFSLQIDIKDISKNKEEIKVQKSGPDFNIKFVASNLKEMIDLLKGDFVTIEFYSNEDPFIVTSPEYPFVYLQSP